MAPQRIRSRPNGGWPRQGDQMTDRSLQASVTAELAWEPTVDGADIAVSAEGSVVTLRGTVSSGWEKHQAGNAAQRVGGVSSISNQLLVRAPDWDATAILGAVVWVLMLDSLIPQPRGG